MNNYCNRSRLIRAVSFPGKSFGCVALLILLSLIAGGAGAVPFHTPTIDGVISGDDVDWDPFDHVVDDWADQVAAAQNVRHVWLTWDTDSLYLGVIYEDFAAGEGLRVFLDLDQGVGPRSAAVLDSFPGNFDLEAGHNIDFVLGRPRDGTPGTDAPLAVRVTDGDGAVQLLIAGQDYTAVQTQVVGGTKDAEKFVVHNDVEFGLPWTTLYPGLNGGVEPFAVIKAVAVIGMGPGLNGRDSAPDNPGVDGDEDVALLANLHASVIDADGDGAPDAADATISGTATLPDDTGAALTVVAELIEFAGRAPGSPLSSVTITGGERIWTLPRLTAGRYRITTSAEGYFANSVTVDVNQSGQVTGIDQTLSKATAISGAIGFASGPEAGIAGTVSLRDSGGTVLATRAFVTGNSPYEFPYVFYVEAGGDFLVGAEAETYLTAETPVTVTTGVDVTDLDLVLMRQTEVSGIITMESGPPAPGTVVFRNAAGDELDSQGFPANGGPFRFFTPVGGAFTISATTLPPIYVTTDTTVTVVTNVDLTGLEIFMPLAARVRGAIVFEGPDAVGRGELYDNVSGAWRDSLNFAAAGDTFSYYLEPGEFRLALAAPGYVDRDLIFNVSPADTSLGDVLLTAVRASHLEIVDEQGEMRPEVRATYYDPLEDPWTSTRVQLAARDDAGRDDLYDLDGRLTDFRLAARKMDDLSPPTGQPVFYGSAAEADVDSIVDFSNGRAQFWMSNTAVEVLRVYLAQPAKEPIAGRIVVAFEDPQPRTVLLTAARDTLVADNTDAIVVRAQLYDSAENESVLPDIPVTFAVVAGSGGAGQFETATVVTNGFGWTEATLHATGAGPLRITASVVVNNRVLDVVGYALDSGELELSLTAIAGATAAWDIALPSNLSDLETPVGVQAQLVDAFGNATTDAGRSITFTVDPAGRGTFTPATAVTDDAGRAGSMFTPAGVAGLVTISGGGDGLAGDTATLQLRNVTVIPDAVWQDEPDAHQTFDTTDLTALVVDNSPSELLLEIPFASNWDGLQLHVIFETGFDAAGAASDPFTQPVNYQHADKPDYALTTKYSANDYGDFRRWSGSAWEFWNPTTEVYGSDGSIQEWVTKLGDRVNIRIPWEPFGERPDSLRMELYLTQDVDGVKRAAFDSAPQDATLDLDFDYNDPQPGDWDIALGPSNLSSWGRTYVVKTDFPTPPTVTGATVTPTAPTAGEILTLTAEIADAGDGVGDVLADLSAMGGGALVRMYDDGDANHGDAVAGDGRYSLRTLVPVGNPGGEQELIVRAYDAGNALATELVVTIVVTAIVEPIVQVSDPVGDDHGPNQPGSARMFITYPTNIAFVAGGFDLTGLTIFETVANVGGSPVDMLAFQVSLVDFPDPDDPGTADWSPLYAEMNIEKIDILIDNAPGGATASLPNRRAAFQPWDAWDYAVIMDGWYKAVIPSLGTNTTDAWRANALRTDSDIQLIGDPVGNTVTALVSKAALGDPTPEDVLSWDIAVCMSSHDFGGEEVLGGIRWVNESRSEWNFGGGAEGDRDPNLIDLLLVPGSGHNPGKTQEEILDYESTDALDRLAEGLTPVAIEMSQFEDTGPPVIDTGGAGSALTRVYPLSDAPLALALKISDDFRVDGAEFRYRSSSFGGDGWDRAVPMGSLGRDQWVVDILPSWLDSNLVYSPIDSTRYLEFEVEATDHLGKTAVSPVTTLQIYPAAACRRESSTLEIPDLALLQVDGTLLKVPDGLRGHLIDGHVAQAWTGAEVSPDTMGDRVALDWDICAVPAGLRNAPTVPPGRPLGIFRGISLTTADSLGGVLPLTDVLPTTLELSLHYPQAWVPGGLDENSIALYEYRAAADRWVLVGGNVTPTGNKVTATLNRAGNYGLFVTDAVKADTGEVLSGVNITPSPFSPNGDGLYDETNISFYLTQEATVTVEIYNIEGRRKNVLKDTFSYTGADQNDPIPRRVPGLIWDGTDFAGEVVPYGVYVLRIIATYNQAGGTRTLRSNHAVAVIK